MLLRTARIVCLIHLPSAILTFFVLSSQLPHIWPILAVMLQLLIFIIVNIEYVLISNCSGEKKRNSLSKWYFWIHISAFFIFKASFNISTKFRLHLSYVRLVKFMANSSLLFLYCFLDVGIHIHYCSYCFTFPYIKYCFVLVVDRRCFCAFCGTKDEARVFKTVNFSRCYECFAGN